MITSPQNPRVKEVARLRDARHRRRAGRYLIDGARELLRAIESRVALETVFYCRELCRTADSQAVLARLDALNVERCEVAPRVLEKLAFGDRAEGVLAVAITPQTRLDQIQLPPSPLVAVLSGLEKPGNIGAVLRSTDAAGVSAVIVADGQVDLFNPNCIRASLGTIFQMPLATASSSETLDWLRANGLSIFAALPTAELEYTRANLSGPAALVLGSEAEGLSSLWRAPGVTGIRLPMLGLADSLNVSATAAVLFYEALRQRLSLRTSSTAEFP
jgi:TrmH family RNA methyltransferase